MIILIWGEVGIIKIPDLSLMAIFPFSTCGKKTNPTTRGFTTCGRIFIFTMPAKPWCGGMGILPFMTHGEFFFLHERLCRSWTKIRSLLLLRWGLPNFCDLLRLQFQGVDVSFNMKYWYQSKVKIVDFRLLFQKWLVLRIGPKVKIPLRLSHLSHIQADDCRFVYIHQPKAFCFQVYQLWLGCIFSTPFGVHLCLPVLS